MLRQVHIKPEADELQVAMLVKENDELRKVIEIKESDVKDLETSGKTQREVILKLNKEMKQLKLNFNKEKTEILKHHKTEVKGAIHVKIDLFRT